MEKMLGIVNILSLVPIYEAIFLSTMPKMYLAVLLQGKLSCFKKEGGLGPQYSSPIFLQGDLHMNFHVFLLQQKPWHVVWLKSKAAV